jgi:hypothetical protein
MSVPLPECLHHRPDSFAIIQALRDTRDRASHAQLPVDRGAISPVLQLNRAHSMTNPSVEVTDARGDSASRKYSGPYPLSIAGS